jgi:hypothetical protein
MIGLQKMLDPGAERSAAVVEDFKAGHLDKKQESGDGDENDDGQKEGERVKGRRGDEIEGSEE